MTADYALRLQQRGDFIARQLEVEEVIPILVQSRVLSPDEAQSLKSIASTRGLRYSAEELVSKLRSKGADGFKVFLDTLRRTGQQSLAAMLDKPPDLCMEAFLTNEDQEVIRSNMNSIIEKISPRVIKILKFLHENADFWTTLERSNVRGAGKPAERKAEALLEHVMKSTYMRLDILFKALKREGLDDVLPMFPEGLTEQQSSALPSSRVIIVVKVVPEVGQTFLPAAVYDICQELGRRLADSASDVHKKLLHDYGLERISCQHSSKNQDQLIVETHPRTETLAIKLKTDCEGTHLGLLIKQYSHMTTDRRPWEIQTKLKSEEELQAEAAAPVSSKDPGQIVRDMVVRMVDNKDFTEYDLFCTLRQQKGKAFRSPLDLYDSEVPIPHLCVFKNRLPLLYPFFYMGWWNMFHKYKVRETSSSALRGKTPLEVAEARPSRRAIEECKMLTEWEESLSSVMKAARSGDLDKVKRLIKTEGEQLHYRDLNNGNALFWAVVSGNLDILRELHNLGGLDSKMCTRRKESLLHVAAMLGMSELLQYLIRECHLSPGVEDINKKTVLDKVAENGDVESLKKLLECGVTLTPNLLVVAAFHGRKVLVEYVLNQRLLEIDVCDQYNRSALLRAVEGSRVDIVKLLLEKNANLDIVASTGRNVLHFTAECGNTHIFDMIKVALQKQNLFERFIKAQDLYNGVELCFLIRGRDKGREAWHYVEVKRHLVPQFLKRTRSGNVDVAIFGKVVRSGWGINPEQDVIDQIEETFRKRRLDPNAEPDCTPLHIALCKGHTEMARLLIENAADVNAVDRFRLTPLMIACSKDNLDIVQLLENKGANFKALAENNQEATDIARDNESSAVINYLAGRDHYQLIETFVKTDVENLRRDLSSERLDDLRRQGRDVRKHLIDMLRDFRINVNQALLSLGSGPILEATDDVPDTTPGVSKSYQPAQAPMDNLTRLVRTAPGADHSMHHGTATLPNGQSFT